MLDLVIRNGTIIDGTGLPRLRRRRRRPRRPPRQRRPPARRRRGGVVVDAAGKVVAPGFVDPHTHYDAQLCFDPYAYPAVEHGITSVVTGQLLAEPGARPPGAPGALLADVPADRGDAGGGVRRRRRLALGRVVRRDARRRGRRPGAERRAARRALRAADVRAGRRPPARRRRPTRSPRCADLLRECLDAGAVGLSTSYVDVEDDMRPVPCRFAEHAELEALCAVLGERGRMLQIVHEFYDAGLTVSRVELLAELSPRFGIATTLSPLFHSAADARRHRQVMAAVERAWAERRPGVAAGADPPDRHLLDDGPAQHHVPGHPRLVERAVDERPGGEAGRPGDPATRQALVDGLDAVAAIRGGGMDTGDVPRSATSPSTATGISSGARSARSPPSGARRRPSC